MKRKNENVTKFLSAYYGLMQSLHLLTIIRAGLILFRTGDYPFPILPPSMGWAEQTMPFMFGLAGMDVVGIILGIIFTIRYIFKGKFTPLLGILSLTIFISGAVIFAAGTFPTGAWGAHPLSYWIMVLLFTPCAFLFIRLLRGAFQKC